VNRAYREENAPGVDSHEDRHKYNRDDYSLYPYKSHLQTFRAWYGLVTCSLLVLFNGWRSVIPPGSIDDFVPSYINVSPLLSLNASNTHIRSSSSSP
jgi:amino acid permease